MSLQAWVTEDVPLLRESSLYKKWAADNPVEAGRFDAYILDITGASIQMNTPFGQFLQKTALHIYTGEPS